MGWAGVSNWRRSTDHGRANCRSIQCFNKELDTGLLMWWDHGAKLDWTADHSVYPVLGPS